MIRGDARSGRPGVSARVLEDSHSLSRRRGRRVRALDGGGAPPPRLSHQPRHALPDAVENGEARMAEIRRPETREERPDLHADAARPRGPQANPRIARRALPRGEVTCTICRI